MFYSFWSTAFPEVFEDFILIDNIPYIPLETTSSTLGTIVVLYGCLFGMAFLIGRESLELCKVIIDCLYFLIKRRIQKKHATPEDIPPTEVL